MAGASRVSHRLRVEPTEHRTPTGYSGPSRPPTLSVDLSEPAATGDAGHPRRFRRHRLAMVGLVVLTAMVLAVVVGPFMYRDPIDEIDFRA